MVKTLCFQCRGHGFDPWLGIPHAVRHGPQKMFLKTMQTSLFMKSCCVQREAKGLLSSSCHQWSCFPNPNYIITSVLSCILCMRKEVTWSHVIKLAVSWLEILTILSRSNINTRGLFLNKTVLKFIKHIWPHNWLLGSGAKSTDKNVLGTNLV